MSKPKTITYNVRMEEGLKELLEKRATKEMEKPSVILRRALMEYLKKYEEKA